MNLILQMIHPDPKFRPQDIDSILYQIFKLKRFKRFSFDIILKYVVWVQKKYQIDSF